MACETCVVAVVDLTFVAHDGKQVVLVHRVRSGVPLLLLTEHTQYRNTNVVCDKLSRRKKHQSQHFPHPIRAVVVEAGNDENVRDLRGCPRFAVRMVVLHGQRREFRHVQAGRDPHARLDLSGRRFVGRGMLEPLEMTNVNVITSSLCSYRGSEWNQKNTDLELETEDWRQPMYAQAFARLYDYNDAMNSKRKER